MLDSGGPGIFPMNQRPNWITPIARCDALVAAAGRLASGRNAWLRIGGATGSAVSVIAAALADTLPPLILLVTAHLEDAAEAADELTSLGVPAACFPALEVLPGETRVSPDLLGQRLNRLRALHAGQPPFRVLTAAMPALMQSVPQPGRLASFCLEVRRGQRRSPGEILTWLEAAGYARVDSIEEPGEFAVRGGLIDIYPVSGAGDEDSSGLPIRLDFFGDEIENVSEIDLDTMASDRRVDAVEIVGASAGALLAEEAGDGLWSALPADVIVILHDVIELTEQGRGYFERVTHGRNVFGPPAVFRALGNFTTLQCDPHDAVAATDPGATFTLPFSPLPSFSEDAARAVEEVIELASESSVVILCANEAEGSRFAELEAVARRSLQDMPPLTCEVRYLHRGFRFGDSADGMLTVVPYHELLHRFHQRRSTRRLRAGRSMDTFLDIKPGDYVVHRDHGIALFRSIELMDPSGNSAGRKKTEQEFLLLEFAKGSRLYVPASKIDLVQRYVGGHDGRPPLSPLGGRRWEAQKEKVREAVRDLASELLRVQAIRQSTPGIRFPADTAWQKQFEAEFPYQETEDQIASLIEIKRDMGDDRPMDRLLCGDVGFGKTELAVRAAFKAAEFGKQSAVLVPTTVLAEQHFRTFAARMRDYPFRVEMISRFQTDAESKKILDSLRHGKVDIIIGTHRLLSADVKFADLGLVIIDEEQRFGVEHKQRLLKFRATADVLTLSATPIPRTLHLSLLGLRDISSLTTPPLDRRAIVTEVIPYNRIRIQRALRRELAREGQAFFVHNRVNDIRAVAEEVQALVPDARIVVGHGQMAARELEDVMVRFVRHQADILVCTTIIESGIDIPNANTMIIHNADQFGLSTLHQLRGRVGRYKHRAYCYLLLPEDGSSTLNAVKRLRAIEEYSMLGAGFKIAMRDLEIRGAGNIVGPEQSGHIAAVGYEMYCHLLEQTVSDLRNDRRIVPIDTEVDLGIAGMIPRGYIPSDQRRMEAYRRICQARSVGELAKVADDLRNAYGDPPKGVELLIQLAEVRILAAELDVASMTFKGDDLIFRTRNPLLLESRLKGGAGPVRIVEPRHPDQPFEVFHRLPAGYRQPTTLLAYLRKRLAPSHDPTAVKEPVKA